MGGWGVKPKRDLALGCWMLATFFFALLSCHALLH